ncbi:hypothetical protein HBI18_233910 [Parastagonospora nodorum]|nr:hypothetical protein HBH61_174660 [Parastagonospora nodorum]KAH5174422.1 hypothetical protein HBH77_207340 [Parastagonospora nodorum]KAH5624037.1 hypothetical protein HBI51_239370 [Parastagonospora nodorum]KAH5709172.1 hypothetical protein HBI18_233910 [Parastagonospora nodorum]KAH6132216.1 hypothetical protein HBI64_085040 [Parastagonospora nodorum]
MRQGQQYANQILPAESDGMCVSDPNLENEWDLCPQAIDWNEYSLLNQSEPLVTHDAFNYNAEYFIIFF